LKELRPIESDLPKRIEENVLRLGGYGIASGLPEDAFESIVNKINEMRKDREFINKFIEIRKWHNLLIDQSEKIRKSFEQLSKRIDARKYNTVVKCCPK